MAEFTNARGSVLSVSNSGSEGWDPAKQHLPTGMPPVGQMGTGFRLSRKETERLRALAGRVAEIAALPLQEEKKRKWTAHNDLKSKEPLVHIDAENGWNELIPAGELLCEDNLARTWEMHLLKQIYWHEVLKDDKVIEATFEVPVAYTDTGWGLEMRKESRGGDGSFHIIPAIKDYEADFAKLHYPEIVIEKENTERLWALAGELFGGTLALRRRTVWWWSMGMTVDFIMLRGLEEFLCDFVLEPEWVHRMMEMMTQGIERRLDWLEREGLLSPNTEGAYVGSGGFGWTDELPSWADAPSPLTTMGMWGFVESQETSTVNPEMYGEFIFPYHKRLAERFGLNCYGCCESVTSRWHIVKQLPRLRRVSVSSWADWEKVPETLGDGYIASFKPSPSRLAMPAMDEGLVRADVARALACSRGGYPELIMKDNHTLGKNPRNASRWVEICREEIAKL
ncbi:MAG: hypothetical protein LBR44_01175 [Clostridiales Family XIII bacterium]|jgi:hypothetical protein|nr:hypothetical protein [Clostridiales Family XIII bacterium]